jgi:hypothetical protein
MKRVVSLLLTFALVAASFASCSKGDDGAVAKAERGGVANVFKSNSVSMPENYTTVSEYAVSGGRVYALAKSADDDGKLYSLVSFDAEGGDMRIEELPYENVSDFTVLSGGERVYLLTVYDSAALLNEHLLCKTDADGNEIFSVSVAISDLGEYGWLGEIVIDAEDRVYLNTQKSVVIVSPYTGETLAAIKIDDAVEYTEDTEYTYFTLYRVGGRAAVQYTDRQTVFKYIDADEGKIGDDVYCPDDFILGRNFVYSSSGSDDVLYYFATDAGLYSVRESEPQSAEVVNWLNSDVAPCVDAFVVNSDRVFYQYFPGNAWVAATLALVRIPDDEIVPKYTIEIGYVKQLDPQRHLMNLAAEFNRTNPDYRVTFTDYKQLSGNLEHEELLAFINMELATGNIPDMLLIGG